MVKVNAKQNETKSRVEYIKVFKLFGSLNHTISLHTDGVTIVHGPNGCGKTTVLRLLSALIDWDFKTIRDFPFEKIELGLGNRKFVRVKKEKQKNDRGNAKPMSINPATVHEMDIDSISWVEDDEYVRMELVRNGNTVHSDILTTDSSEDLYAKVLRDPAIIKRLRPTLRQVGPRAWRDMQTDVRYTTLEVCQLLIESFVQMPDWLVKEVGSLEVGFINAQRLLDVSRQHSGPRPEERASVRQYVELYSDEIKSRINEALNKSAIISQRRERSFPERMLSEKHNRASNESILNDYTKLQERFAKLSETGLQEEIPLLKLGSTKFNPTERRVLGLYLEDLNEKLNVFSELQDQIDTFKIIVGKKFRRKILNIDRNSGFAIVDEAGEPLSPGTLSSGEQHQIVMFYDLIFSKKSGLLFLIDEPEISLHVEWQRQFLSDLAIISKLKGHQFLIATHSPQVIGTRRDIAIPLDGGVSIEAADEKIERKKPINLAGS
ncbi:AAA family ATPase [Acidovorax sp. SUPP1855]|uniref:AAA family ATPase n=1 Tax=Acidovorax sp. SUPP1855 TaxID=431774 RepID=UPI0023DE4580|nr:AAA family ATPase [Acidovorax sp. SUPP1855]GKS83816.1 AAA family ATPase [Acidovorax sp. SUPP1855]